MMILSDTRKVRIVLKTQISCCVSAAAFMQCILALHYHYCRVDLSQHQGGQVDPKEEKHRHFRDTALTEMNPVNN